MPLRLGKLSKRSAKTIDIFSCTNNFLGAITVKSNIHFDEEANENEYFWQSTAKLAIANPVIIFTKVERAKEPKETEYPVRLNLTGYFACKLLLKYN